MSNESVIAELLAETREVIVNGKTVTLSIPSHEVLAELRALGAKAGGDPDAFSEDDLLAVASFGSKLLAGCLDCDEESASRLLAISGGETGDLMQEALKIAGMKPPEGDDADLDEDF